MSESLPEKLEPEPAAAEAIFGEQLPVAREYARHLELYGDELGLIGPKELPRLWSRHLLNCGLLAPLLRPGTVGDVGSGAGLPGLVLAILRPDVRFVLIEPMERRSDWLRAESARLRLDNVSVLRARAQDADLEEPLDQVTARAVSALRTLIPATARLLRPGGEMLFLKGSGVEAEVDAAAKEIRRFRLQDVRVVSLGHGIVHEETRVFAARVDGPAA